MSPRAIVSKLTNPFANLALETVLFKHKPVDQRLLFIYFNEPCIVIGRNQNPWAECNLSTNIPILRRRSGGGAVVHDLENANFCVQFPRTEFSRSRHIEMIVNAFPRLGLQINDRNDILLNSKKVSGSSYKIEKNRAYHHATLLLNSDLANIGPHLRPQPDIQGRVLSSGGTESVRSPITNTLIKKSEFVDNCIAQFQNMYGNTQIEEAGTDWVTEEVQAEVRELQSWDWVFGKTPKFTLELPSGKIVEVVKGHIDGAIALPRDVRTLSI